MTTRHILLGIAFLAAGVLLGVVVAELWHVNVAPSGELASPTQAAPTPPATESVQIGNPNPPPPPSVPELISLNTLFKQVAANVTPSVVFIRVETDVGGNGGTPEDGFHDNVGPFLPRRRTSAGSGVILSPDGYVVTNNHVVEGASRIRVLLNDKREYDAELIGSDPTTDIAIVRLLEANLDDDADVLPVATLGDSDALEVGEWVLAVGNPFRLTSTVTAGIVSALRRQVDIIDDPFRIEDFIQTDAAINPGNSGGALVNMRGEVVGIATAIATESGAYEGYGFAVPINLVKRVATDLIERGEVLRGYLAVEIRPVTAADAQELGMSKIEGVIIASVAEDGPAARAGIRARDVLLSVDGRPVDEPNQFQSRVAMRRPGESVTLEVWRAGELQTLEAVLIGRDDAAFEGWLADLGERNPPQALEDIPPDAAPPDAPRYEAEDWGVRFRDLTPSERRSFGVSGGAFVENIAGGSAAEVDGLPVGSVVTRIEDRPVSSAEEALAALGLLALREVPALLRVRRSDGVTAFYDLASPYVD